MELAKKELAQSKYNGEVLVFKIRKDYYIGEIDTAQACVEMWKKIGVNVELQVCENWSQVNAVDENGIRTYDMRNTSSSKVIASLIAPEDNMELSSDDNSYDTLSSREQEVLRLLAEGREIRDIAKELCISSKTVINHRTNIMQKLNCSNMVELIKYAIHIGLVDA